MFKCVKYFVPSGFLASIRTATGPRPAFSKAVDNNIISCLSDPEIDTPCGSSPRYPIGAKATRVMPDAAKTLPSCCANSEPSGSPATQLIVKFIGVFCRAVRIVVAWFCVTSRQASCFLRRCVSSSALAALSLAPAALASASDIERLDSILYFSNASSLSFPAFQENPHPTRVTIAKIAPMDAAVMPSISDQPDHQARDDSSGDIFMWVAVVLAVSMFLASCVVITVVIRERKKMRRVYMPNVM